MSKQTTKGETMMTIEKIKAFTRQQPTATLVGTLTKIEESAEVKQLRDVSWHKVFSREQRISRAVLMDVIQEREGEEFVEFLYAKFAI